MAFHQANLNANYTTELLNFLCGAGTLAKCGLRVGSIKLNTQNEA